MHVCRVHGSVCTWYIPSYGVVQGIPTTTRYRGGDGHIGVVQGIPHIPTSYQYLCIQHVHGIPLIGGVQGLPGVVPGMTPCTPSGWL